MSPQTTTPTLHEIHADDVREHTPLPHDVSTQAIPVVIPEGAAPVVTCLLYTSPSPRDRG